VAVLWLLKSQKMKKERKEKMDVVIRVRIRELSDRRRFEVSSRGVSFTVPRNIEISWIVDTIKKLQEEIFEISKKGR